MNIVFATQNLIKTSAVVEVTDVNADPTPVPVTSPLVAGQLDLEKKRTFDLLVSGNCKTGDSDAKVSFIVDGEETAPDFFTLKQGKIVFAEPHPMGTITMPRGHQSFVKISLQSINAENSEESQKWVCLGIRKKDTKEYLEYLHMPSKLETHIEMYSENVVELVPLVSAVDLSTNDYVAVEPGKEIREHSKFSGLSGDIKFSAVYRIDVQNVEWLTEQDCDFNGAEYNYGSLGVGPIGGSDTDHMVGINYLGNINIIKCSSDGINQDLLGRVTNVSYESSMQWYAGPKYGEGIWCAISDTNQGVAFLKCESWTRSNDSIVAYCLEFGEKVFMTIKTNGEVYTSGDTETWTKVGSVPALSSKNRPEGYTILICGGNKWICGDYEGNLYLSENTGETWDPIEDSNLTTTLTNEGEFYGGCYANGYFYVTKTKYSSYSSTTSDSAAVSAIAKSLDGRTWTKVVDNLQGSYHNVTYYKGKLYAFRRTGKKFAVGMP